MFEWLVAPARQGEKNRVLCVCKGVLNFKGAHVRVAGGTCQARREKQGSVCAREFLTSEAPMFDWLVAHARQGEKNRVLCVCKEISSFRGAHV
jgi:hypothetical protein